MTRTTPDALAGRAERERRKHGVEVMPDGTVYVNGCALKLRADFGTYATPDDGDVVTLGRTE